MRQARNPPCADPDTTPSKRPAGAKGLRLRPGPNIDRMSLIRYSVYGMVYGHRQPASPLVFWGRFVVGFRGVPVTAVLAVCTTVCGQRRTGVPES